MKSVTKTNAKCNREALRHDRMAAARAYVEAEFAFQTAFELVCRKGESSRQTSLKAALDKLEACEAALGIGPILSRNQKPSLRQSDKSFRQTSYNTFPGGITPRRRASDFSSLRANTLKSPGQSSSNSRLERIKARVTYLGFYLVLQPHPEVPEVWMADVYRIHKGELVFVAGTHGGSKEEALEFLAGELGIQTDVDIPDPRD